LHVSCVSCVPADARTGRVEDKTILIVRLNVLYVCCCLFVFYKLREKKQSSKKSKRGVSDRPCDLGFVWAKGPNSSNRS